jgi:pimeloyl-ACP methyl ester carboxylesterase
MLAAASVAASLERAGRPARAAGDAYAQAKARIREIQARDDDRILPSAHTNCFDHGRQTDLAVVLFHGFTNNPMQFARLAAELYARGCNVLVPRLPGHGDVDRMTNRLESLTADQLVLAAMEAVDAAQGLGQRLAISGISLGGALCALLATRCPHVDRCVPLAPALALNHVPYDLNRIIVHALTSMPRTEYAWWDPQLKERITPKHAYPRYPLRALGECYRIGEAAVDATGPFPARDRLRVVFEANPLDGAVNNALTERVARRWNDRGYASTTFVELRGLPPVHDVIEPDSPQQRVAAVYPKIIELIVGALKSRRPFDPNCRRR